MKLSSTVSGIPTYSRDMPGIAERTAGSGLAAHSVIGRPRVADMTVKLVVLYTQPDDAETFDEHYFGKHGPLVDTVPGLERWEGARFIAAADGGEQTYHRMAELYFTDEAAMQAALASDAGKATSGDYQQIAPPGSRMFVAAVD
jgi:uncharacterized protein (TIGR02118 family)